MIADCFYDVLKNQLRKGSKSKDDKQIENERGSKFLITAKRELDEMFSGEFYYKRQLQQKREAEQNGTADVPMQQPE